MKNFYVLADAITYIEKNLCEPIWIEDVAKECYSSVSGLQKLFRYALHIGPKEYIVKRRLTNAANDLLQTDMTVTEIALKYQYQSPEVFIRAFRKLWDASPTAFKKTWKFSDIFPKINYKYQKGDDLMMARKNVDLADAYETFKNMKNTYVLCFDVIGLMSINDISREAGDKAILETARRIDSVAEESMLLLRIGGDEFALVTGLEDAKEAEMIANSVLELNGFPISVRGQEIALSLRVGAIKIPEGNLRYSDFFTNMHNSIKACRAENVNCMIS